MGIGGEDHALGVGAEPTEQPREEPMAPMSVLLARLANMLESARISAKEADATAAELHIVQAQELLEVARDGA